MAADGLTRTHFQLDSPLGAFAAETLAMTLRRIPGVLLADIDANGRITFAHDAAVEKGALLAGVQRGGGRVVDAAARSSGRSGEAGEVSRNGLLYTRGAMNVGLGLFIAIGLLSAFLPNLAYKQWLPLALVIVVWTLYFTGRYLRRTRR